jgi:hypothetical protein
VEKSAFIVIGDDTGNGYSWGDPNSLAAIKNASKPLIGIGIGGSSFYQAAGLLDIGWGQSWTQTDGTTIYTANTQDSIWSSPRSITPEPDSSVTLYSMPSRFVAVNNSASNTSIFRIGRQSNDPSHYPIIAQDTGSQCYKLWGFSGAPNIMTTAGKDLFINSLFKQRCARSITNVMLDLTEVYCAEAQEGSAFGEFGDEVYFELHMDSARGYRDTTRTDLRTGVTSGSNQVYSPPTTLSLADPGDWLRITVRGWEQDNPPADSDDTLGEASIDITHADLEALIGTPGASKTLLLEANGSSYVATVKITVE